MYLRFLFILLLLLRLADVSLTAVCSYLGGIEGEINPIWRYTMETIGIVPSMGLNVLLSIVGVTLLYICKAEKTMFVFCILMTAVITSNCYQLYLVY